VTSATGVRRMQRSTLAALHALLVLTAVVVALVPGWAPAMRSAFGLAFRPPPPDLSTMLGYATANARPIVLLLLGAFVASRSAAGRCVFDLVVGAVLSVNVVLVGVALGAYGIGLVPWLLHLPLELAALATAAGAYRTARRATLPPTALLRSALISALLLVAAAFVETYVTL
jgi:hypothetical protein